MNARSYKGRLKAHGFTVSVFLHEARIFPQPNRRTLRIDIQEGCVYCAFIEDRRIIGRKIREWCRKVEANPPPAPSLPPM